MGVAGDVRWLGHVDRDALPAVYPSADVCVFISTLAHEGQGLTFSKRWPAVCPNKSVAYASSGATSWWCTA